MVMNDSVLYLDKTFQNIMLYSMEITYYVDWWEPTKTRSISGIGECKTSENCYSNTNFGTNQAFNHKHLSVTLITKQNLKDANCNTGFSFDVSVFLLCLMTFMCISSNFKHQIILAGFEKVAVLAASKEQDWHKQWCYDNVIIWQVLLIMHLASIIISSTCSGHIIIHLK